MSSHAEHAEARCGDADDAAVVAVEGAPLLNEAGEDGGSPRAPPKITVGAVLRWCGVLCIALFLSMEAMGYQALLPALYQAKQFEWECTDAEVAACGQRKTKACCTEQQSRLDLMFTLAYVFLNLATVPLSALMHRYPPRYITCGAFLIKSVSYVLLALSTDGAEAWLGSVKWQNMSLVAYTLVASMGLSACLPFLSLPAYLFGPVWMGLASSSLMGASDASSVGYYAVRMLYLHTELKLREIFLAYAVLAIGGAACSYQLLLPLGSAASEARKESETGEIEPVLQRLTSGKFLALLQWYCAFFVVKYFFMTNITAEGQWLTGNDDRAYALNTAFSLIMPATGILAPLVGWLLAKGMRLSICVNAGLCAVLLVCSTVKVYALQYGMLVSVAASRFMVFSIMPTLCAHPKMYGPEGGVFFSIMSGIGGAVSLVNFGLTALSRNSFMAVNITLCSLCLVATVVLTRYLTSAGIS
eukprot:Rhum_TRINITY_DN23350_c0_g1::Rhum_TRINITY_DN23350_c0_g1_i1::g.177768::m.177768